MVKITVPLSLFLLSTASAFSFEPLFYHMRTWHQHPIFAKIVHAPNGEQLFRSTYTPPAEQTHHNSNPPPQPSPSTIAAQPGTGATSYIYPLATSIPSPSAQSKRTIPHRRQDSTNSGTGNTGTGNSGIGNTGSGNSGDYNCGNGNSGNYNSGNGNSGSYNSGNGQSGNGNNAGVCGNVVVSNTVAYIYPAASTVVVQQPAYTSVVVYNQPQVYTTYVVYQQPAVTSVIYQAASVVPIVTQETTLPRGCAYWESLGYQCSAGSKTMKRGSISAIVIGVISGFLLI